MLSQRQTESLIQEALTASSWDQVSRFMRDELGVTQGPEGVYVASLAKYPELLANLQTDQMQSLLRFATTRSIGQYPELSKHLNVEQRAQMKDGAQVKTSYPAISKIVGGSVESKSLLSKILSEAHPSGHPEINKLEDAVHALMKKMDSEGQKEVAACLKKALTELINANHAL